MRKEGRRDREGKTEGGRNTKQKSTGMDKTQQREKIKIK